MGYSIQFNPSVREYVRNHPGLAREDRVRIFTALDRDLRQLGDRLRNDHLRAPRSGTVLEWRRRMMTNDAPPLGQRLLDRPFLLLLAGVVVMAAFYTLWGLYEILSLPRAPLP